MQSLKRSIAVAAGVVLGMVSLNVHASDLNERPDGVGFGSEISESDLELWDIDIQTPTGVGLPPGEGTVSQGLAVYQAQCLACHGENTEDGSMYGSMVGGIGSMTERPRKLTPGSMYPYAPILFDYVRRAMPMDRPHSMTNDDVYAVSAYLYHLNGLIDEDFKMNAETMPTIEMPNRDAFIVDDRPDVQAERCMSDCKPIGTVADGQG
jgi:S-disulfanyl-L-cysteine oxidoreductase SoxD